MMIWTTKKFKVLIGLLVLVHLTLPIDYVPVRDHVQEIHCIEFLESKEDLQYREIGFELLQIQQGFTWTTTPNSDVNKQVQTIVSKATSPIAFKIQNHLRLNISSLLRLAVLNEIMLQRSYWI